MSAVFEVVVEEDDIQRTVDVRRLLHRVRWANLYMLSFARVATV